MFEWQAVERANAHDWVQADNLARTAERLDPDIGSYALTAGLTAARAGDHEMAVTYFQWLVRQNDLPEAWLDLAAEQAQVGQTGFATAALEEALRVGYQRPVVSMPAGDLALRLGRPDLADTAFTQTLLRAPSLGADPWWQASPERKAALGRAVEAATALAGGPTAWEIPLMASDTAKAREMAVQDPDPGYARSVIDAWLGDSGTADALVADCIAHPLAQRELLWCARIESNRGRFESANRLLDLANISFQSSYVFGTEFRVSDAGMVGRQLIGDPADLWATYTYRRPGPWDILVPSLIHLKLA